MADEEYREIIEDLQNTIDSISKEIEEKERKHLQSLEVIKGWGNFGWGLDPQIALVFFEDVPSSIEEANDRMNKQIDDGSIFSLIDELSNAQNQNQSIIAEAIRTYQSGFYYASSLVLFSLIDSWLIHWQDNKPEYSINRKQGSAAIKRLGESIQADDVSWIWLHLNVCHAALNQFFRNTTPNFVDDSNPILSRHMLMHGMWTKRPVTKMDCEQLMLLYENLLYCSGEL